MKSTAYVLVASLIAGQLALSTSFGVADVTPPDQTSAPDAQEIAASSAAKVTPETADAAREAASKAAAWLAAAQHEDGHWGMAETPALTALAMWALQRTNPEKYADQISTAAAFVVSNAQPDGAIYSPPRPGVRGGGLANYNTAICLSALHSLPNALTDPAILRTMQNARTYLAGTQYLDEGLYRGGIGYDPEQPAPHADLPSWREIHLFGARER